MTPRVVLRASAIVMLLFGLVLLLAPNALLEAYRAPAMNSSGTYNAMLYGSMLVAVAFMNWSASTSTGAQTGVIVLGNLLGNALGFLVCLYRQLTDAEIPDAAWFNVVLFLLFAMLYAQLHLRLRAAVAALPGSVPAS